MHKIINVAKDFTPNCGGELIEHGPYSGELFRTSILRPLIEDPLIEKVTLDFSDACIINGFLRGAFTNLQKELSEHDRSLDFFEIVCQDDDLDDGICQRAQNYICYDPGKEKEVLETIEEEADAILETELPEIHVDPNAFRQNRVNEEVYAAYRQTCVKMLDVLLKKIKVREKIKRQIKPDQITTMFAIQLLKHHASHLPVEANGLTVKQNNKEENAD